MPFFLWLIPTLLLVPRTSRHHVPQQTNSQWNPAYLLHYFLSTSSQKLYLTFLNCFSLWWQRFLTFNQWLKRKVKWESLQTMIIVKIGIIKSWKCIIKDNLFLFIFFIFIVLSFFMLLFFSLKEGFLNDDEGSHLCVQFNNDGFIFWLFFCISYSSLSLGSSLEYIKVHAKTIDSLIFPISLLFNFQQTFTSLRWSASFNKLLQKYLSWAATIWWIKNGL